MSQSNQLNTEERIALLDLSKASLRALLNQQTLPKPSLCTEKMKEPGTVFVSIYCKEQLRGCIGSFSWETILWEAVQEMTCMAASKDPRFSPIKLGEFSFLTFELSVLSKPETIEGPDALQIGRDGLILMDERKGRRGVLLPQVATKYQWTPKAFLENTCTKASLEPNAWQEKEVVLKTFQAEIIK